jgi:hypothetical protein
MAIIFDKTNKLVTLESPIIEVTIQELINAIRDFEDDWQGIDIYKIADCAGKEDLGGEVKVGITLTLLEWKIKFEDRGGPTTILCKITGGNLVAVDENGNAIDPVEPSDYVMVMITSSSSATLQELGAIQYSSFNGGVTVDVVNGVPGTDFPKGTSEEPVNNTADALLIATERGFDTLYVVGDITLDAGTDFLEVIFVGASKTKSLITIDTNADVENCEFYDAEITGVLDGGNVLKNCLINNLTYVNGYIEQCVLGTGTITLGGNAEAHFLDCWSGVVGAAMPSIDMGGAGQGLGMRNYNGAIKLKNKTGAESVSIDLNSGRVILESTVTNGKVITRGVGLLVDEAEGRITTGTWNGVTITNQLVNPQNVADGIWDGLISEHLGSGSFGEAIEFLKAMEGGKWKIVNNQMIFYKADNVTEVARFNLYDISGSAAMEDIYERRRV